jgi:hypothetical protein
MQRSDAAKPSLGTAALRPAHSIFLCRRRKKPAPTPRQSVAVVQRAFRRSPLLEMREMGFGDLRLLKTFHVHLAGSQRQLNAYIFVKEGAGAAGAAAAARGVPCAVKQEDAGDLQQVQQPGGPGQQQQAPDDKSQLQHKQRRGAKRGAAAAAPVADNASSDASCDSALPLSVWLRVNGLAADAASSEATSRRERRKRRLS